MSSNVFHHNQWGLLILRLMLGIFLLLHGLDKLASPGSMPFIEKQLVLAGLPTMLAYGVYIGEIVAPLMLIIGFYTRWGAMLVVINMLFVLFLAHDHQWFSIDSHGAWALELQGFYLFSALALVFLGSGKLAVRAD